MDETILSEADALATAPVRMTRARRPEPMLRRPAAPAAAGWKSSLEPNDLACLLQVIESQLLPRLLGEYRPAHQSPLKASRSG